MNLQDIFSKFLFKQKYKKTFGLDFVCTLPFYQVEIDTEGEVFFCCNDYTRSKEHLNGYIIGNIYKTPIEEVWNGKKAQNLRKSILNKHFNYCKLNICSDIPDKNNKDSFWHSAKTKDEIKNLKVISDYPKYIKLNIDHACNARCIMCRDKVFPAKTSEYKERFNNIALPAIMQLCQNAEIIYLDGSGELFYSDLCRKLCKKLTSTYKNAKFDILSNGLECTKEKFEDYGFKNNISEVKLSIHAATENTYNKVVRGGKFQKILNNLQWLKSEKEIGNIPDVAMNFVVSSINYKDMIAFQELANSLGFKTFFSAFQHRSEVEMSNNYDDFAVFLPSHPEHKEYVTIVKNNIFNSESCKMAGILRG